MTGFGANKGFKVVTKAVNGVVAGKELWFPNAGRRYPNGTIYTDYPPGKDGIYCTATPTGSTAYVMQFYSSYPTGLVDIWKSDSTKLWGLSVRCVR